MIPRRPSRAMAAPSPHEGLAWRSYFEAVTLICRGRTCPTAARIALLVGTILTAVNQGSAFVAGAVSWQVGAAAAVNYLVPFVVSSFGYLAPFRATSRSPGVSPPNAT